MELTDRRDTRVVVDPQPDPTTVGLTPEQKFTQSLQDSGVPSDEPPVTDSFTDPDPPPPAADPPPADPPPVAPPTPPQQPQGDSDPLAGLPETHPKPDDWATMRGVHKENVQRIKDLEAQAAAAPAQPPAAPPTAPARFFGSLQDMLNGEVQPQPGAPTVQTNVQHPPIQPQAGQQPFDPYANAAQIGGFAPQVNAAQVFQAIASSDSEYGETDPQVLATANQLMNSLSPTDVQQVIQTADLNGFGENSQAIAQAARLRLPEVQLNWQNLQQQQQAVSAWDAERQKSGQTVMTMDGMQDTSSEIYQRYMKAAAELEAQLPVLRYAQNAPTLVMEYMELQRRAELADKVPALQQELQKLRGGDEPQPSGNVSGQPPAAGDTPEARLRQSLMEAGVPDF